MNILCLETSAAHCTVLLYKDGTGVLKAGNSENNHAESIFQLIQEAVSESGIELKDLDAIAISDGPGSYTGLRIGASSAKGLCFALGIPLIAINTLKSLAWKALKQYPEYDLAWALIDARRMEVYQGLYDRSLKPLIELSPGIIGEEGFIPEGISGRSVILCGDGAAKASDILGLKNSTVIQNAENLPDLAVQAYLAKDFVDLNTYEPFYLKSANITQSKKISVY